MKDTNQGIPQNCHYVKYVESVSSKSDFASSLALAKIRLRNKAGEYGANLVVVTKTAEHISYLLVLLLLAGMPITAPYSAKPLGSEEIELKIWSFY